MTAGSPRSRSPALRSPRRIIERRIDGWIDGARGGVARGGERSRCARVFIAPYCIPIKSSGAGSRRTVKATDARYFCRRSLAARLSFFSPSRGAHPQRTISAPASLPVLNRPHCFFSAVGSHERRGGRIIICISSACIRAEVGSKGERILSRYHPPVARAGILEGTSALPSLSIKCFHRRVIESAAILPVRFQSGGKGKDSGGRGKCKG